MTGRERCDLILQTIDDTLDALEQPRRRDCRDLMRVPALGTHEPDALLRRAVSSPTCSSWVGDLTL